jgi:hypothetical protein
MLEYVVKSSRRGADSLGRDVDAESQQVEELEGSGSAFIGIIISFAGHDVASYPGSVSRTRSRALIRPRDRQRISDRALKSRP